MKQLSRVVWSEGMHLAPHHFQAQSRYYEDTIHFATSALWFAPYGFSGWELDAEALKNGTVSVVHARGLFPDGLPFHLPECDPPPPPRNITDDFSPVADRLLVYLGVPGRREDGPTCVLESGAANPSARYVAEPQTIPDENTGRDEKVVRVGRKNLRLYLEDELSEDVMAMPLARIMRDGAGHFVYDPEFIPPCLKISASPRLTQILTRLLDVLEDKSATLAPEAAGGEAAATFSQREVAGFWFRHSVNSALSSLRNLCLVKQGHPEEAYMELARLAGALSTFALDATPADIPLYDHDHLDRCFGELDERIRFHLETVLPTNCVSIALAPTQNYFYAGKITDARVFGRSRWIFSIRSRIGEAELIRLTPQLVKICSRAFIGKLVERALPGLTLTHLPVPPSAVAPKVERQYFAIAKAGPCWEHMVKTREVGVYVPGELPSPEIGIHVILGA